VKTIVQLVKKDLLLEFRNFSTLSSVFIFVLGAAYIFKSSFATMEGIVWNSAFWILILFVSINAMIQSFSSESGPSHMYYYQILSPIQLLFSKILYNFFLLFFLYVLAFFSLLFVGGNPIKNGWLFGGTLLLAALSFSLSFSFLSGMIAKSKSGMTLLSILAIPTVVPTLLLLLKLTADSMLLIQDSAYWQDIYLILGINLLIFALCIFLFPNAWKD
jgi:heme exporter protein B